MTATSSSVIRCTHSEGPTHPVMGDPMRFIMTAEQTGGAYALSEIETRPGGGAPPHIHHHEEECFYVLEGTIEVTANGTVHRLEAGDFAHVPRGVVRSFTNPGTTHARMLIMHNPGAAAGFYIGMGKLPFPPQLEAIKALGDQYGIELVAP
ncbi:MAG: cupin domain-containing protein [Phycisphaeraceae bacterium]